MGKKRHPSKRKFMEKRNMGTEKRKRRRKRKNRDICDVVWRIVASGGKAVSAALLL